VPVADDLYRFHSCLNRGRHSSEMPTIVPVPGQRTLMWKRYYTVRRHGRYASLARGGARRASLGKKAPHWSADSNPPGTAESVSGRRGAGDERLHAPRLSGHFFPGHVWRISCPPEAKLQSIGEQRSTLLICPMLEIGWHTSGSASRADRCHPFGVAAQTLLAYGHARGLGLLDVAQPRVRFE
jgi:hypothetical protein